MKAGGAALCLEENNGWNAARRCNKSKFIHHDCPRAGRKLCLESTRSWSLQGGYWFILGQGWAGTFHPASLADPPHYLTSSWHLYSYAGCLRDEICYCRAYVCNVVPVIWFNSCFCPCCRRRAVWNLTNRVHAPGLVEARKTWQMLQSRSALPT